jgi:hypothetical protein
MEEEAERETGMGGYRTLYQSCKLHLVIYKVCVPMPYFSSPKGWTRLFRTTRSTISLRLRFANADILDQPLDGTLTYAHLTPASSIPSLGHAVLIPHEKTRLESEA